MHHSYLNIIWFFVRAMVVKSWHVSHIIFLQSCTSYRKINLAYKIFKPFHQASKPVTQKYAEKKQQLTKN